MVELILEVELLEDVCIWETPCALKGERYPLEIVNRNEFEFESNKVAWDDGLYSIPLTVPYDYDPKTYRVICKGVKRIGKNE